MLANNISQVALELREGAVLKGAVNPDNKAQKATVSLGKGSVWELTGDSYVTSITDEVRDFSNIKSNGYNIYCDKSERSQGGMSIDLPGGGNLIVR